MADQKIQEVETDVDKLVNYLKDKGKTELKKVAKELGIQESVLQTWVDFLVEENVLGVEYSLTKPYVFLNDKNKKKGLQGLEDYKKEFKVKADKKVPEKTAYLWRSHIQEALENKKEFFIDEAKKRGLSDIDSLWEEYKKKVGDIG